MSEATSNKPSWRRKIVPALSIMFAGTTIGVMNPGVIEAHTQGLFGKRTTQEKLISDAASRVYGDDITVACTDKTSPLVYPEDWRAHAATPMLPFINIPFDAIVMRPWLCDSISEFVKQPESRSSAGLHALAHELSHLMGKDGHTVEADEAIADCYGTQRVAVVAEALGATSAEAIAVAEAGALVQEKLFAGYNTTDGCYEGGQYDLDLHNPGVFPPRA